MRKQLKHIAFIMDGNGRWAKSHGLPRSKGHEEGIKNLFRIYESCLKEKIEIMSVFAFSTENWNRPKEEVEFLFSTLNESLTQNISKLVKDGTKILVSGDISKIPEESQNVINECINKTKECSNFVLNVCLNYGGKNEIVKATKEIALDIKNGKLEANEVDEKIFEDHLYVYLPPIDLLIRTGGETRISNFMLWQLAYAEMIFEQKYWPDFNGDDLKRCIEDFKNRERRFGGIKNGKRE